jgi:hypothetical protein
MGRIARTGIVLLLMSCGLALTACARAGTITVTTTADTVADDGRTSLREAFAKANESSSTNTIVLATDATYDLTNCTAGALVHATASLLTISGNGATVHQTCADAGIMASSKTASALVISKATLVGGPNSGTTVYGAGINVQGSLVLDGTVTGVDAGPGGTVVDGNSGGPEFTDIQLLGNGPGDATAITGNRGTAVRIRDGGMALGSGVSIADNAGDGLRLDGTSSLYSEYALIEDNAGWGISFDGVGSSRGTVAGAVERNGHGGISCSGCVRLDVSAFVSDNGADAAPGSGGGVVFLVDPDGGQDEPVLSFEYADIRGNRARRAGGGVYVGAVEPAAPEAADTPSTAVRLWGTFVTGNATIGDHPGGGIAVTTGHLDILEFSQVSDNVAGGIGDGNAHGGGVYFQPADGGTTQPSYFNTVESFFERNQAGGSGGGVYVDTPGFVWFQVANDLTANTAGRDGGGAYVVGGPSVNGVRVGGNFFDNVANGRGGGAYVEAEQVRGHFRGNRATEGGGLFVQGQGAAAQTSVGGAYEANIASVHGGGIAVERSNGFTFSGTASANSAPVGGGLWIEGSPVGAPSPASLSSATIVDNSAPTGAGVAASGELQTSWSLIARPLGGGTNCAAEPARLVPTGWSWVSDATCGVHPTDTVSTEDPQLLPFAPDPWDPYPGSLVRAPVWLSPVGGLIPADVCGEGGRRRGAGCEPGAAEIVEAVRIDGTPGPDDLVGTTDGDYMRGFEDDDVLRSEDGNDQVEGGPGDDWLLGGAGNDTLIGGDGDDVLIGGDGDDVLIAVTGDDSFDGGPGADVCLPAGAPELQLC